MAVQKGVVSGVYQSYLIYASANGEDWSLVVDYGTKKTDTPHDYIEFEEPFKARYIKLQNKEYTVSENFSVRDLRIFGKGQGSTPRAVNDFSFPTNIRLLSFSWSVVANSFSWAFASGGHLPEARWASIIS